LAADQGLPGAQYSLSSRYLEGEGVPQDKIEALKWISLAARLAPGGWSQATERRDTIAKDMPPEQIAEAEKRANEWLAAFEKRKK
jgi:hypothetical protein